MSERRFLIEARNRTLAIEDGVIAEPRGSYPTVFRFPDAEVRPGLINAHDHLHRNHYGRLGAPPYADAVEWAHDMRQRHRRDVEARKAVPRREALLAGGWKNLFAGVTTVVHHDRWEPDFEDDFPLHVPRIAWANSLGMPPGPEAIDPARRFCLHVAEGTNAIAADEVRQLQAMGLLGPNLVAVHGLGMDEDAVERFRASGAALVWCPSSNQYLFGRTVPAGLVSPGVDVLLGSDSLLTGAGNLLDELRLARGLGLLSDQRLEAAVGEVAARRLGLRAPSLEPGEPADIVVLSRPLLEASAEDVWLVVVDGIPRVVAPALAPFSGTARLATVGGVTRWVEPGGRKHRSAMNRMAPWANLQREAPGKFTRGMRA